MSSPLHRLQPAFAELLEGPQSAIGFSNGHGEAGQDRRDPVLVEMRLRNLSEAIAQGVIGAEAQLGVLIGRALCEGQDAR